MKRLVKPGNVSLTNCGVSTADHIAKALEGENVKELLSNVGSGGGAPAAGSALPAASAKVEEKAEEKEEESDDDMVCTLFDFQHRQVLLIFF